MTSRDLAHLYASLGWPVLPLRGKLPITSHGVDDATTDPHVIERWPATCNVGIRCDRLLVVDIDPRSDGHTNMAKLVAQHGPMTPTIVARTGGGGWHYLYQYPGGELRGKLARGVDLKRGPGGYIVAPPSVHPESGRQYRWVNWNEYRGVPSAAPAWLLELARPAPAPAPLPRLSEPGAEYARARAWLARVEGAVSGQNGHDATYRVACRLTARGLSRDDVLELMLAWNQTCRPPWSRAQLERKVDEARRVS